MRCPPHYYAREAAFPEGWWEVKCKPLRGHKDHLEDYTATIALFKGEDDANHYVFVMNRIAGAVDDHVYAAERRFSVGRHASKPDPNIRYERVCDKDFEVKP